MDEVLVEVLSQIDDPETIRNVLSVADTDRDVINNTVQTDQPKLQDDYDRYLSRRRNRSPTTRAQYKRTIPVFIEFANSQNICYSSQLTTGLLDDFVDKLKEKFDADATILTYTSNVRAWLRWLNKRGRCDPAVYHILDKDELGLSPKARDEALPSDEASDILRQLRNRRYGTPIHTVTELIWNGGPRIGGLHSTDLPDFDPDNNELEFRHRPKTGTRLKNGCESDAKPGDGERYIELKDTVVEVLQTYIRNERPDVTDDYGRQPLFATKQGRACQSTLRRWVYEATSCRWAADTQDKPNCDGTCDPDSNVCPQSYYPHAIRRGTIVAHLSGGLRPDRASERFDVSVQVLKKHYDPRTKRKKKEDRVDAVREAWSEV